MRSIFTFCFLIFCNLPYFFSQNYLDSLDQELMQISMEEGVVGFGAALIKDGQVLYSRGFGYSDKKQKQAYTQHNLQNIGSISKTFIGVAIMKAIELEKITLNSKINDYLPFEVIHPYFPEKDITLKHLATHTSGIKDGSPYERSYVIEGKGYLNPDRVPKSTYKEFQKMKTNRNMPMGTYFEHVLSTKGTWYSKKNFYKHAPGSKYEYSNIGAALAAYVLEQATGESFETFTQKHILDPIGMEASGWHFSDVDMSKHSQLYLKNHISIPRYFLITFPDGGFLSSIHDMALYVNEVMKGYAGKSAVLAPESFQEMMRLHTKKEDTYGIFWEVLEDGQIGHNGGDPGIFTYIQFDPKTKVGRVMFTNTDIDSKSNSLNQMRAVWRSLAKYGELYK